MITQSPDEASVGSGSGDGECKLLKVDSCSASSQYSGNNGCERAFDGSHRNEWVTKGEGEGSFIIANLVGTVGKFSYKQRPHRDDWNKDIRLEFSDGSSQTYQLQATADVQMFTLSKAVKTTFVKIVVVSTHNTLNNGAAEIEFFGSSSGTADCGESGGYGIGDEKCTPQSSKLLKVDSCSASSQYSGNNGCERAFDGSHRNEWVTKGEGEGSFIIANLVGTVGKFSYKQRPHRDDWNKDIRLEFSDGSSQTYQLQATADVQMFTLSKAVKTTFVKIVVVSTHNTLNNGAAEIEFFECSSGSGGSGGSGGGGSGGAGAGGSGSGGSGGGGSGGAGAGGSGSGGSGGAGAGGSGSGGSGGSGAGGSGGGGKGCI